jgi:uncharacterized membrane protein YfcA
MAHLNTFAPAAAGSIAIDAGVAMRAARRGVAILRAHMAQSGSLLPLSAAALTCAVAGPLLHAPDAVAMGAISVASAVSSIAGFAFSAICGSMLFHMVPNTVQAVHIMILCSIANQAAMTWSLRRAIDWRALSVFLSGGAAGLPVGVWLLMHVDRALYTAVLGVFLLAYGAWMLLRRQMTVRRQHPALDVAIGFIGGITGGAAGFPGAAVTIWCGFKGWDKTRQRALFQPFILLMQVAALVMINMVRPGEAHGFGFAAGDLMCIPASLLGTAVGLTFFRGLSDSQFTRAVNVLMIVSGLSYVV